MQLVTHIRILAMLTLLALIGERSHATSPECGQSVQVVREVKACSAEAFILDHKIQVAYERLLKKFRGDTSMLESLRAAQAAWRQYLNVQCALEHSLPLSELELRIETQLKFRRSGIECAKKLLTDRLVELEAL